MTDMPAMLLWTDAYLGDTGHLSTFEHGAYLLILMAMWRAGGTLPDDDETLARCAKVTLDKWRKISPRIRGFMEPVAEIAQKSHSDRDAVAYANGHNIKNKGLLTQKRLMLELKKAQCRRKKLSLAGILGNESKALKKNKTTSRDANRDANAMNTQHKHNIRKKDSFLEGGQKENLNCGVYVKQDSKAGEAWNEHAKRTKGASQVWDKAGGWWFPTEYPPSTQSDA